MDDLIKVNITVEQIAAVRVILKLEMVSQMQEFLASWDKKETDGTARLLTLVKGIETWNKVDQAFALPMYDVLIKDPKVQIVSELRLTTPMLVKLLPFEHEFMVAVVNKGIWRKTFQAHNEDKDINKHTRALPLVVISRCADSLLELFKYEAPTEEVFGFPQKAAKGLQ